jgi:maltooligosyltrehalose trehalohydrolase
MLFMGEEWAATTPFPFFSDYGGELGEAVRRGRARQLAEMSQVDEETLRRAPDPQAESTFLASKLRWEELTDPLHAGQFDWYRRVLAIRRERILPLLDGIEPCGTYQVHSGGQFQCEWEMKNGGRLSLRANLCAGPSNAFGPAALGELLWLEGSQPDAASLGPWSVCWSLEAET